MTEDEFAKAVRELCQDQRGSVTSWGRTNARSAAVGGYAGDPHTHWFGADVVWDNPKPVLVISALAAYKWLRLIREGTHDHLQPVDYPVGPLTPEQAQQWRDHKGRDAQSLSARTASI